MKTDKSKRQEYREMMLGTECNIDKVREVSLQVVRMMDEDFEHCECGAQLITEEEQRMKICRWCR
jgi:hypothetical protein